MSRWLQGLASVNNLLEQLDGTAENVSDSVGVVENAFANLLDNNRQDESDGSYEEEEISEDDEEYDEEDLEEEEDDYVEESVHSDIGGNGGVGGATHEDVVEEEEEDGEDELFSDDGSDSPLDPDTEDETLADEDAISIGINTNQAAMGTDVSMVSDISVSEGYNEEDSTIEVAGAGVDNDIFNASAHMTADIPPRTPNRQRSGRDSVNEIHGAAESPRNPVGTNTDLAQDKKVVSDLVSEVPITNPLETRPKTFESSTPLNVDQSPQIPRRSFEKEQAAAAVVAIPRPALMDDESSKVDIRKDVNPVSGSERTGSVSSKAASLRQPDSDPPKQPTRQVSIPLPKMDVPDGLKASLETGEEAQVAPEKVVPVQVESAVDDTEMKKLLVKIQGLQAQVKKANNELKTSQAECKRVKKEAKIFSSELEAANAEIAAHRDELDRAAEQMEKERSQLQEEREEMLDEHDEEIEQLKETHNVFVAEQKEQYESLINGLRQQLQAEEEKRLQEGGNWTNDLKSAMERERSVLIQLSEVKDEKEKIEKSYLELREQSKNTQAKLNEYIDAAKVSAERERNAEDKLDAAMSAHAHQISQRQAREAELERTVFDLGAALTKLKSEMKETVPSRSFNDGSEDYKEKYERSVEELDTIKAQLEEETQRREALQQQLGEISGERAEEQSRALSLQRQFDQKIAEMELANSRLSATIREQETMQSSSGAHGGKQLQQHVADVERYKQEFMKTSEQLLRHQERAESYKAEILALKGRLQSANKRAEEAEVQASSVASTSQMYEMEGGGLGYSNTNLRRRVKGGRTRVRGGSTQVRSIRSALGLNPGRTSPAMEQVAGTIDALDKWMVDTGAFLRHEPLARFGCLLYFITLHLWSFALVVFHTTEQPHADFGSMDTNPRHWRPR